VPVLCLACEKDPNAPAPVMERMAARIPGARYVCLPGLGHLPNLEAPAAFDAAILDFLRHALPLA
jgi:3-oxoadipate enol-lactonase